MKRSLSTLMCALTFLALLASLAVPALAAPADAPEWEEGDRWAYGMESDVGAEFADQLEDLADLLEDKTNGTVNELSIDAEVGLWFLFEVTDATSEEYVLSMTMAGKLSLDAAISVTASMPVEGTYAWDEEEDLEEKTVSVEVNADASLMVMVDVTFERDTMAIESVEVSVELNAAVDFVADNLPMDDDDWDDMTTTYWYEDYDVSGELEFNLDMSLEFSPALNLWDFPLDEGDEWSVDSTATLSGSMSGLLDVQGLPDDVEDEMFDEGFVEDTGMTGFPIIFEDIDAEDSPFNNGQIEEVSQDIELDLLCTDVFTEDDTYWGDITVYEISAVDAPMSFYYSPQVGFMSYMSMDVGEMSDELDLPSFMSEDMKMDAVDPDVAENKINEISDFQGDIGGDDGGIAGFFTDAPYLGLILVGVITIVVVAAVLLIKKK